MAAEVIAGELGLDLYRIDLSAVVSKYIGETEKNLRRLFDAAEAGGAVLLFDEADALFGKRSEVKDSHDRYANLEVAYLLQRMESYRGLAILTTNLRTNVDQAFLRRLRFVVQFPFPDEAARAEIWRRAFPPTRRSTEPSTRRRWRGSRSPAARSARSRCRPPSRPPTDGTPVRPEHVLRAAQVEYAKAERTLTDAETAALRGGGVAMTRLEIEVDELVLRGLPAAYAGYADGLAPLVEQRLGRSWPGAAARGPARRTRRPVTDQAALADLVARQVWQAARPHADAGRRCP